MYKSKLLALESVVIASLLWGTGLNRAATPGPTDPQGLGGVINYDLPNYANSPLPQLDGTVKSIRVTDGGCGYTDGTSGDFVFPIIVDQQLDPVSGLPIGTQALAQATVVGGVITGITLQNAGAGYLSVPNVTIPLPSGVSCKCPASAVAIMGVSSGGLRKFVDSLPGLGAANANLLGQYIPVAVPDTVSFPGSDYYEIAVVDYTEQMHSDLKNPTKLRGYVQLETAVVKGANPGSIVLPNGKTGVDKPHYLGPLILAKKNVPTRIKFYNLLPAGTSGDLFIPVDTTVMGAGMGGWAKNPTTGVNSYTAGEFPQNRATLHLHGGFTPWVSDGTPHQWTVPFGDLTTVYQKGVSSADVPDMPASGQGVMTFYYPNQQSGRLMFYHDHAYGLTRLNVYAGEAAGYLLQDPDEDKALADAATAAGTTFPADQIPLVIQDKTFVWGLQANKGTGKATQGTWAVDPLWADPNLFPIFQNSQEGDLWFPHVYMANQNPADLMGGANPLGRWDYGPWFWPPQNAVNPMPIVSTTPESFMDTPVVNGTAYPYLDVKPQKYRLRILNACNDRFLNLQLYLADSDPNANLNNGYSTEVVMVPAVPNPGIPFPDSWKVQTPGMLPEILDGRPGGVPDPRFRGPAMIQIGTEGGLLPGPVLLNNTPVGYEQNKRNIVVLNVSQKTLFLGPAERADVIIDFSKFAGKTVILYNDSPAPVPAGDPRLDYYTGNGDYSWTAGPNNQGGAPSTLPGYGPNMRTILQFRVGPGNDSSAPVDDYDLALFNSLTNSMAALFNARGETPIVPEPDYPPNVVGYSVHPTYSKIQDNSLTFFAGISAITVTSPGIGYQSPVVTITPAAGDGGTGATAVATIDGTGAITGIAVTARGIGYSVPPTVTITDAANIGTGATATATLAKKTLPMQPKAIHELFDTYGRMNSVLGVELPFTSFLVQTTIPYEYIDPVTESIPAGQTQIWKITHNGVDTHAIHFHLVNVQVINRVGWDGAIRPPDANEIGWKETVRMNPLEDCIVAATAKPPGLPFALPKSSRVLDVVEPLNTTAQFTKVNPLDGTPVTVTNLVTDFDWEYVWHCHLLGHEENDMMRPLVMRNVSGYYPTVTAALTPPSNNGWYAPNTQVSIVLTAADFVGGPGIASLTYAVNNGAPSTVGNVNTPLGTTPVSAGTFTQATTLSFFAADLWNITSWPKPKTVSVQYDGIAPTLTVQVSPPQTKVAPGTRTITVSGTVTDTQSGVVAASGKSTVTASGYTTTTQSFTIAANGSYSFKVTLPTSAAKTFTITVNATDNVGNTGSATGTFKVQ